MKSRILLSITTAALLGAAALMSCTALAAQNEGQARFTGAKRAVSFISASKAKEIALNHAGVAPKDAKFVRTKLDRGDGEYEIEFYTADREYDYEIDAVSGTVLGCDFDAEHYTPKASAKLTEADAKKKALAHAKVAEKDAAFTKTKLDRDDGKLVYDVEFYTDSTEYDYEVDAQTGDILSFDQEARVRKPKDITTVTGGISQDEAKKIALAHAKVAENKTSHMKVKRDRDDGITVYEVEFDVGRTEYSYDIDAATGKILKYEIDEDD